ncbi:MAG TPA: type II secretion system minor pseudopilin GspH [Steroidobacteraceae bacterium]|nr:type II secretion system minor pseudopilin GspH [Steroidobacteraceae bacterium]
MQRFSASQCRGFTLLEILVVLVIIAIIAAATIISVGVLGRDREIEDQSQRLWAVISQVKEESELTGHNIGVLVDQTGYEFVQFDSQHWSWKKIEDDDLLASRQLPEGLRIRLKLEGREVVLKPHSERASEDKPSETTSESDDTTSNEKAAPRKNLQDADMAPQIMLLASGDVNSFDLSLARDGTEDIGWRIFSKPDNSIDIEKFGETDAAH